MTKNEICERLAKIRDNSIFNHGFIVGIGEKDQHRAYLDMVSALRSAYEQIGDLILDIATSNEQELPQSTGWPDPCGCKGDRITVEELKKLEEKSAKTNIATKIISIDGNHETIYKCPNCRIFSVSQIGQDRFYCNRCDTYFWLEHGI